MMLLFMSFLFLLSNQISVVFAQQATYSLSSLDTTQVTDLTSACNGVYTTALTGCGPSDFLPTNPCSSDCINSLTSVQTMAQAACAGESISTNSVLSFFSNGQGVKELCTIQKSVPTSTTFMMSVMSSTATNTAANSATASSGVSVGATPSAVALQGGDTSVALPKPTVIAIVIVVIVVISVLVIVGVVLFRKYYK